MVKKKTMPLLALFAAVLLSCGIDTHVALAQVSEGSVNMHLDGVNVFLPSVSSLGPAARSFVVFYRLFISAHSEPGTVQTSPAVLNSINTTLTADFNFFFPFTDPTSAVSSAGMGTIFANRNFFELYVNTGNNFVTVSSLLGLSPEFGGGDVQINFPSAPGDVPYIIIPGVTPAGGYPLARSVGQGSFSPLPTGRLFQNHPQLNDNANAGPANTINRDVAANAAAGAAVSRFVYISMYVLVQGVDVTNFSTIFSRPTRLGIFMLPDTL